MKLEEGNIGNKRNIMEIQKNFANKITFPDDD